MSDTINLYLVKRRTKRFMADNPSHPMFCQTFHSLFILILRMFLLNFKGFRSRYVFFITTREQKDKKCKDKQKTTTTTTKNKKITIKQSKQNDHLLKNIWSKKKCYIPYLFPLWLQRKQLLYKRKCSEVDLGE